MLNQLPNVITGLRILGVGVIFWLTPYTDNLTQVIAISLYAVICLTDALDGWIARRFKMESDLGKVLDPLADKILVLVFLPLLEMQIITSFPVFIILAREFAMMGLRVYSVQSGRGSIPSNFIGKLKTIFTFPVCGILFARVPVENLAIPKILVPIDILRLWVMSWPESVILFLIYSVVALTIWSFIDYFDHFLWAKYIKKWGGSEEKARQALRSMVPNAFSVLNLIFGICGIYNMLRGDFRFAALFLILCVVFDAIDGSIARRLNAETKLGATLDSVADVVSFAIFPSIAIFIFLSGLNFIIAGALSVGYCLATVFRLIRFSSTGYDDYFEGLPSPFSAAIVMFSTISNLFSSYYIFITIITLMGVLMVSKFKYPRRQMAVKQRFLKFVQFPAFIFTVLSIGMLIKEPGNRNYYVYDMLVIIFYFYVLSPIFYIKSSNNRSEVNGY